MDLGPRHGHRGEAGKHPVRRPAKYRAAGIRAAPAGSGARGIPEFVRHAEDAGADSIHVEEWKTTKELKMEQAVIVDCVRTAVGKATKGTLRKTRPDDMAAAVIRALME